MKPVSRLMNAYSALMMAGAIGVITVIGQKTIKLMITAAVISIISFAIGRMRNNREDNWLKWLTSLLPLAAFLLLAFRANSNLLALIGIVQHELDHYDAYNKCINLIFLLFMASASLTTFLIAFTIDKRSDNNP